MRTLSEIAEGLVIVYAALSATGCVATPQEHYHQSGHQRRAIEELVITNPSECRRHNFVPVLVGKAKESGAVTNQDLYNILFQDRTALEEVRDYASSRLAEQRLGELRLGDQGPEGGRPKSAYEDMRPLLTDTLKPK